MPDRRTSFSWLLLFAVYLATIGLPLSGCKSRTQEKSSKAVSTEFSTEGLAVMMLVSSDEIATSDVLELKLTVQHDASFKVQLLEVSEKWGDFFVAENRTTPARLNADGKVELKRTYILEPDLPGEAFISEFVVQATRPDGKVVELKTEPVGVRVTSVLDHGETKIRDIAPNQRVDLPVQISRWPVAILLGNVILVVCLILVWVRWKKVRETVDDSIIQSFRDLKSAPASELMKQLERSVCQVVAQKYQFHLTKVNFAGLEYQLNGKIVNGLSGAIVNGLSDAVASYEELQYGLGDPDEEQARALYTQFETLCENGEEMES